MRPGGFTLIEMVVSLSVMSIVFLAMGSVMLMATKAIPDPDSPTRKSLDAADVLRQFATEVQTARTVTNASPKVIEFTVPDRDNDASDEDIKYEWSGTAGDPLLRQYNGGAMVAVLPAVYEFDMTYVTIAGSQQTATSRSSEIEMSSYLASNPSNYAITSTQAVGQSFMPSNLPLEADYWNVTRVVIMAKGQGSAGGQMAVQLRTRGAGGLPGTLLEQQSLSESVLTNQYAWQSITFNNVQGLSPTQGLCVTITQVGTDLPGDIQHDNRGAGMLTSSNNGSSWAYDNRSGISHFVYGTYDTPVAAASGTNIKAVSIVLNANQVDASRVRTAVAMLNRPELP